MGWDIQPFFRAIRPQNRGCECPLERGGYDTSLYFTHLCLRKGTYGFKQECAGAQVPIRKLMYDTVFFRVLRLLQCAEQSRIFFLEVHTHHVGVHLIQIAEGG